MSRMLCQLGLVLALGSLGGVALAAPQDAGQWRAGWGDHHSKPDWQRRVEQQERRQRHAERNQEWQRQQREELRRRAERQQRRDAAWLRSQENEQRWRASWQRDHDWDDSRWDDDRDDSRWDDDHDRGRHRGHHKHHWRRGHRYDGSLYVVRNYGRHGLRRPPQGYHWVRADNDYLLVAIATRVILDIVAD